MNLETLSNSLIGKRVIITGCGYKPVEHVFTDIITGKPTHDEIIIDGKPMKLNIGAATAAVLAYNGATVHMVSKSEDKLKNLKDAFSKENIDPNLIEYSAVDLFNWNDSREFCRNFPRDKNIYWVQSLGISSGSVILKNENPYGLIEDMPVEFLEAEQKITPATHVMFQELLPYFRKQDESHIAIITSMSAIRGYAGGAVHCAAKADLDRYANSVMIEKYLEKIYVSTIRPGCIDTGLYDSPVVQKSVIDLVSKTYNVNYDKHFATAPPIEIAKKILIALTTNSHDLVYDVVAKGQWPNVAS